MFKRFRLWFRTLVHGPRARCRCGMRRMRAHRCPDCGQLRRGVKVPQPSRRPTIDPLSFDFEV